MQKQIHSLRQSEAASQRSVKNETLIIDLPSEIFLIIYENLELIDLNSVARSNPLNKYLAETVFNTKFNKESFSIGRRGVDIKDYENIGDMDVLYSTLQIFGHLIRKLVINYNTFSDWETGLINERVSKYVTNSLVDITLNQFTEKNVRKLTGPFHNVQTLRFQECMAFFNATNLTVLFPAVRSIQFGKYQFGNSIEAIINHHFVHLEEIKEFMYANPPDVSKKLFDLNPQLKRISLKWVEWDFLRTISETLSQLEHIEIDSLVRLPTIADDIRFENLKSFKILVEFPGDLQRIPIVFGDKLEEIVDMTPDNSLSNFILQHKHLTKIGIGSDQFEHIAQTHPNLMEFQTRFLVKTMDDIDKIVRFIEMAKNLRKIEIGQCETASSAALLGRIQDNWELAQEQHTNSTIFIRI